MNTLNPLAGSARGLHLQLGGHTRTVFALALFGLLVFGVFAYMYWREWQLRKAFRQYSKTSAGSGAPLPITPAVPRDPFIKTAKPQAAENHSPGPNPAPLARKCGVVSIATPETGAEVFVDHRFQGNTPARLALDEGLHLIAVKTPGYRAYERELQVTAGSEQTLRPMLERLEDQPVI